MFQNIMIINFLYIQLRHGSLMCCLGRDFGFHMNRPIFDFISEKSKEIIRKQKTYLSY